MPEVAQRGLLGRRVVGRPAPLRAASIPAVAEDTNTSQPAAQPTPAQPTPAEQQSEPARVAEEPVASSPDADSSFPSRAEVVEPEADGLDASEAAEPLEADSPAQPTLAAEREDSAEPAERSEDENLLFARQSPVLSVETMGPRRISVGKESTYAVIVRNSGQVAADQVVVTVALPDWADVLGAEVSRGGTGSSVQDAAGAGLRWEVGQLKGGESEKLVLRIVPCQSQPFDLGVQWDYTPAASQAVIEVQEPKLQMRLEGPHEVLFGQSEVYRLELANSGTGDAENVELELLPFSTGESVPSVHNVGTIEAGQTKVIELELTARQTGALTIKVDARADGGATAQLAHDVTVQRPALAIDVQAPSLQYVGTDAECLIRVGNPGTATARGVALTATIPPGAEYVSSNAEGQLAPDQRTVTWNLGDLQVGAEVNLQLTCNLARGGVTRLEITSTATGGLIASRQATIRVEAIADLELDVTDPAGPIPVQAQADYQVRIRNRGTKSAEQIEVVAYFSQGIEPVAAEGGRHQMAPGEVLFDTIPSLAAGQEVSFKIKAKAEAAGNHVCRVEVYCKPLGTRLVSEETTYFYGGPAAAEQGPTSQSAEVEPAVGAQPIRTADRRPTPAPTEAE